MLARIVQVSLAIEFPEEQIRWRFPNSSSQTQRNEISDTSSAQKGLERFDEREMELRKLWQLLHKGIIVWSRPGRLRGSKLDMSETHK
jgi:hypothetical protein